MRSSIIHSSIHSSPKVRPRLGPIDINNTTSTVFSFAMLNPMGIYRSVNLYFSTTVWDQIVLGSLRSYNFTYFEVSATRVSQVRSTVANRVCNLHFQHSNITLLRGAWRFLKRKFILSIILRQYPIFHTFGPGEPWVIGETVSKGQAFDVNVVLVPANLR